MGDMNLIELVRQFHDDDESCRSYLEGLRWPKGPTCPRCRTNKIYRILKRDQFVCDSCSYQFSVTAGTIFHDSHLPLWKWVVAVYLMVESKKGMSANQLKRTLKVSYKTAWYLCHRIRAAMTEANPRPLRGRVELDKTYVGGKRKFGSYHQISAKHLDAYLDEFEWRFNNRKNPFLFRDMILRLIGSPNLEYKKLTSSTA